MRLIEKLKVYREKWLISKEPNDKGEYDLYEYRPVRDTHGNLITSVGRFRFWATIPIINKKIDKWIEE